MARGNINRKYLRRRKRWFKRNLRALIAWFILICVVVALIIGGVFLVKNIINKVNNSNKEINWIKDVEPERNAVEYYPPSGIEFPYYIKVNRAANCVTVYGIDDYGQYSIPVKAFACSCGVVGQETITGENFTTTDKYLWRQLLDDTYAQYAFRIEGSCLFHSVPYLSSDNSDLDYKLFNKLGEAVTNGCIMMAVSDVKWLYDNCPAGTKVTIYDDELLAGPLGKPETIKIPEDSPYANWDPTEVDRANPWMYCNPSINNAKDIVVKVGETVDVKAGVTATDTCGNDITDKIYTVGEYTFDKAGEYDITYKVVDAVNKSAQVTVKLIVKNK